MRAQLRIDMGTSLFTYKCGSTIHPPSLTATMQTDIFVAESVGWSISLWLYWAAQVNEDRI